MAKLVKGWESLDIAIFKKQEQGEPGFWLWSSKHLSLENSGVNKQSMGEN